MIFPFPYTKGEKLYPIIGFRGVYQFTESDINGDLAGEDAFILLYSEYASNPDYKVNAQFPLMWQDEFGIVGRGYAYALFPNNLFPEYHSFADWEQSTLNPLVPYIINPGDLVWVKDTNFSFNGNTYSLYICKGRGDNIQKLLPVNVTFYKKIVPNDISESE
jgi:hypothetical protein